MKLSIEKTTTEKKEIEITLPFFFSIGKYIPSYYAVINENCSFCVSRIDGGYVSITKATAKDHSKAIADESKELITKSEFMDKYSEILDEISFLVASNSNSI